MGRKKTRRTQMARIFEWSSENVEVTVQAEDPMPERPTPHVAPKGTSVGTQELQRKLVGRGIHNSPLQTACLCARPKSKVFCHFCGYIRMGRKKLQCPQHPSVHFLYDVETCQNCHAQMWYLEEYLA